jgi:hypothetical protein
MKKLSTFNFQLSIAACLLLAAGCTLDNYESADTVVNGLLLDAESYEPVQTEAPNGAKVRFYEKYNGVWSPQPYDVWVHQDGTFSNNFAFAGEYKVVAEGAFFPADTQVIRIADTKKVALYVTPYLHIDIETRAGERRVSAQARIRKSPDADKIQRIAFMISKTPNVSYSAWMRKGGEDELQQTPDEEILDTPYAFSFSGLDTGRTYYIRVGALSKNDANAWNYSKVVAVKAE